MMLRVLYENGNTLTRATAPTQRATGRTRSLANHNDNTQKLRQRHDIRRADLGEKAVRESKIMPILEDLVDPRPTQCGGQAARPYVRGGWVGGGELQQAMDGDG